MMVVLCVCVEVICLMRASGAVTQSFNITLPDFTKCFVRRRPLASMLSLATTTSAFTTRTRACVTLTTLCYVNGGLLYVQCQYVAGLKHPGRTVFISDAHVVGTKVCLEHLVL